MKGVWKFLVLFGNLCVNLKLFQTKTLKKKKSNSAISLAMPRGAKYKSMTFLQFLASVMNGPYRLGRSRTERGRWSSVWGMFR